MPETLLETRIESAVDTEALTPRRRPVRRGEPAIVPRRLGGPWPTLVLSVPVLLLGAVEGWFGRTDTGDVYGSDGVQYLDCARAIGRGDWHSALNPLWSQGYPALLAAFRPLFGAGSWGDWLDTRAVNFGVFALCWGLFVLLLWELGCHRRWTVAGLVGAGAAFAVGQICLDRVSRVGPDQMLAAMFFLSCTLLLRLLRLQRVRQAALLGLALGLGFLVKAAFLPLGLAALGVLTIALWIRPARMALVLVTAATFLGVVLPYGVALSHAVGRPTLGESGSLNYAWHVNRLGKWVHWEGGNDPASKAWPKPWIARAAGWESAPPDFGRPLHPSQVVGSGPAVYVFHEAVRATYVPYYDPSYWYVGYRHLFRWRFQAIALVKNFGDLLVVVLRQPLLWAFGLILGSMLLNRRERRRLPEEVSEAWPLVLWSVAGVMLYLPVHLEGRYLAGFLVVLSLVVVRGFDGVTTGLRRKTLLAVLLAGFVASLLVAQGPVWARAMRGWSPDGNVEWRVGYAAGASGLQPGSEIGMISWTPNLHSDWAYMAGLRITSEIQTGADEAAFWRLDQAGQAEVLGRFQQAGARAVLTWDRPPAGAEGWEELGSAPMWMHRF